MGFRAFVLLAVCFASGYGIRAVRDKQGSVIAETSLKEEGKPLFGNSANTHLDRMVDIPKYVNLNEFDKLDRNNFWNGTCTAWNQYIPYCSFCTAPL